MAYTSQSAVASAAAHSSGPGTGPGGASWCLHNARGAACPRSTFSYKTSAGLHMYRQYGTPSGSQGIETLRSLECLGAKLCRACFSLMLNYHTKWLREETPGLFSRVQSQRQALQQGECGRLGGLTLLFDHGPEPWQDAP